ncbi:MAG: ABC transporter ATP-binding protein [Bacteroidales bacterium]
MSEKILEIKALTFSYGEGNILDGINLSVPKGAIYGYLGKNGAGKTTTINLILKLLPNKPGSIFYNNEDICTINESYFYHIGVLIQPLAMYNHLTCYEQLKYLNFFCDVSRANIEQVLKDVDMFDHRNKKIKILSAGMKQRLSIAMALLHNPDLLILDEPINGLDPNGINEFRALMKDLNKAGKTIFISSHILGEMQKMCSHIGIIDRGKLLFQDSISKIVKSTTQIKIRTSDTSLSKDLLQQTGTQNIDIIDNDITCDIAGDAEYAKIINTLCARNIDIYDISKKEVDLESFYLNLIK